ncbi:hypothetical protein [Streptomyces chartreusis]|uniref:hypothetical protein n=1 Tax=Streptomyces chartreusis TaxID=1969 RepID=UPI003679A57E
MHRILPTLAAALLLAGAATACSEGQPDSKPTRQSATPKASPSATAPDKLADYYKDKLDAVSDGSIENCQTPSSTPCSNDIGAIMTVIDDLERDIDAKGGASAYPTSTQQIAKMRAAQQEYEDNVCEGNPASDDPNSDCWGIVNITLGATTLSMTLSTDELT